jgi:hypothetical protein
MTSVLVDKTRESDCQSIVFDHRGEYGRNVKTSNEYKISMFSYLCEARTQLQTNMTKLKKRTDLADLTPAKMLSPSTLNS